MTNFWIIMSIFGSILTIISAFKISQIGSDETNEIIRKQNHPIPENLFMDIILTIKVDRNFKSIVSEKILPKIHIEGSDTKKLNVIPIAIFFDEIAFEKNQVAKNNYDIHSGYFSNLKKLSYFAITSTEANSTQLSLSLNPNMPLKFTKKTNIDNFASINIQSFNKIDNTVKVSFKNLKVDVAANSFWDFT